MGRTHAEVPDPPPRPAGSRLPLAVEAGGLQSAEPSPDAREGLADSQGTTAPPGPGVEGTRWHRDGLCFSHTHSFPEPLRIFNQQLDVCPFCQCSGLKNHQNQGRLLLNLSTTGRAGSAGSDAASALHLFPGVCEGGCLVDIGHYTYGSPHKDGRTNLCVHPSATA